MRYYLGTTEYKWTHSRTDLEQLWIRRELGDDLFKTVESNNWEWILIRSNSQTLPNDIYCRCDVYADSKDNKLDTHFVLKFPKAKPVSLADRCGA